MTDDELYALKNKSVLLRRQEMLDEPHVKPLADFVKKVRLERGEEYNIPDFDPLDGGIEAKVLFLFESPGGGVAVSEFVSRENPDRVARMFRSLCDEAGIARKDTILWNSVPWWVESGVRSDDVAVALPYLRRLMSLLPNLEAIVLMGTTAASLQQLLRQETNTRVFATWMPSPRVFNRWKGKRREVEETFQEVARLLNQYLSN
ncbi:MAG TPA: uracil-DNA glycosylase [Abditibacteriaceae bacterium]